MLRIKSYFYAVVNSAVIAELRFKLYPLEYFKYFNPRYVNGSWSNCKRVKYDV